jgi:hypothetical protein
LDRDLTPDVIAHAGYSACDHPQEVLWEGKRLPIKRIVKEWREPNGKHYLVETGSGMQFNLTLAEPSQRWLVSQVRIRK